MTRGPRGAAPGFRRGPRKGRADHTVDQGTRLPKRRSEHRAVSRLPDPGRLDGRAGRRRKGRLGHGEEIEHQSVRHRPSRPRRHDPRLAHGDRRVEIDHDAGEVRPVLAKAHLCHRRVVDHQAPARQRPADRRQVDDHAVGSREREKPELRRFGQVQHQAGHVAVLAYTNPRDRRLGQRRRRLDHQEQQKQRRGRDPAPPTHPITPFPAGDRRPHNRNGVESTTISSASA